MKIDPSKVKNKNPRKLSVNSKLLIDKLKNCNRKQLHELLKPITIWHMGNCDLYHWIDVLDLFDSILQEACIQIGTWMLNCDKLENEELKMLILDILHFTELLMEHSYSRYLYNSMEHLTVLLQSFDINIILGVLSIIYVFSKRSNLITRLPNDKKQILINRIILLVEIWGERKNGFDLARCCSVRDCSDFLEHATHLHFIYTIPSISSSTLVRQCTDKLINNNDQRQPYSLCTASFSFLYHLALHQEYVHTLVNSDISQLLIKVVNYYDESQDFIKFVTRAVRVIDVITTSDMTSFHINNALIEVINRLKYEITQCQQDIIRISNHNQCTPTADLATHSSLSSTDKSDELSSVTCYHQRIALFKSILTYLKKAFIKSSMIDITCHMMNNSLLNSLKHIISYTEYYGPSLFHLATDVIISFIFQQPSYLSSVQDNGLIDILMNALFRKDLLAEVDVLVLFPNICSVLCFNTRGLEHFMRYKPFDKLNRILSTPKYLSMIRRKHGINTIFKKKSSFENALDQSETYELNLRAEAMKSIIRLLAQLVQLINDPKYDCQELHSSTSETDEILLSMFNHPRLSQNKESLDTLFQLLSLISQHFPTYFDTKEDILSNDKVVLDSQLDLIIKILTSKLCTEVGLEFAIILLLNISKINQITRDKILHLLCNDICLLGNDLNEELEQLHCEIEDYLSKTKSSTASNRPINRSLKMFGLYERIPCNTHRSINTDLNAEKEQDLQFPSMNLLTSKSGNQQFFLHILKLIIQLHEQIDVQTHSKSELPILTHHINTLRSYFSSNNTLELIDQLSTRSEQISIQLQNPNEQIRNTIPNISHLIRQIQFLIDKSYQTSFSTCINNILQIILSFQQFSIFNFDIKKEYFHSELNHLKENIHEENLFIHIRYDYIIFDHKENENSTEWYSLIIHSIFDLNSRLFIRNSYDHDRYIPNPLSDCYENHLEFSGHIIGKCIFDDQYINYYFTRPFYKYILDIPIDYEDMELNDVEYYKNLLENDLEQLDFDELILNGSTIRITNENKCEYVRLINSFVEGFYEIIPKDLLSIFNEQELELLISDLSFKGLDHTNTEDIKTNK